MSHRPVKPEDDNPVGLPLHLLRYIESRHIGLGTVKPVDKIHDIWHSSYKCSYMEACNEIR